MPDLHFTSAVATADEREALDGLLGDLADERRDLLLPCLHAVHDRVGWISQGALNEICRRLAVAPAEAYGVATFYAMFSLTPRPPRVVHVCDDIACLANGAADVCAAMEGALGEPGQAAPGARTTWLRSPCLGLCERAPAALVMAAGAQASHRALAPLRPAEVPSVAAGDVTPARNGEVRPQIGGGPLRLLRRVGHVDPASLDDYRAHDGYVALRRAFELGPAGVVGEVIASKLLGRGGAAFPSGRKMEAVAKEAVRPHYLVCNADESEPGTFKDRIIMEHDPFALIESMTIAAFATACERGYIYVRGEYPLAAHRLEQAIEQARARGLLGEDILGKGLRFDVELRRGAGAYICGEETALFNSIEGKRGEPRNKPPFPTQAGLFGKPTLENNVETLVCLPQIVLEGGAAFARIGTDGSTGPKLFCLSGAVERPGLYEVPFGTTLGALLDLAGGVRGGRRLRTVLLGGAAGAFVGPEALAMPLTFEATRAAGATLGSGVVMVFDETIDPVRILHRITAFFRDESCGQCVPCRVGTVRQEEALHRLTSAASSSARTTETDLIAEIARAMRDASICGLGQTAASAVESALKLQLLSGGYDRAMSLPTPIPPLPPSRPRRTIDLTIDGAAVRVEEGTTLLEACRQSGIETPTLCYLESLTPVNACRVCVVELEGSHVLVPACARKAEDGMVVKTESERVRHSRKMVLEFLGSSVDLSTAPEAQRYSAQYGADPARYGSTAATVKQPAKIDNGLYMRDYSKCIACYKCVEACGTDAQNTFAIAMAGRGFDAHISTEFDVSLPDSACVYCGNCIGVCPTGALMFSSEHDLRASGAWDEEKQTQTDTICSYCGVGCTLTLHVQDNEIVKVTSPIENGVTSGHLCIKGRFGGVYVQNNSEEE